MKVPKAKIVKMIQEMLDEESPVNVTKTVSDDGETVVFTVTVPGSSHAKAVFNEKEARELVEKLNAELN